MRILLALLISAFIGYQLKIYRGPASYFVNNLGPASVLYEVCWILLFAIVFTKRENAKLIAIGVCLGTCILEFLQLWTPPWLQSFRQTTLGSLLLGQAFDWWDFPAYFIGSAVGYFLLLALHKKSL